MGWARYILGPVNQSPTFRLDGDLEVRMSNFVTLVVEDDAFQREALAELLKDDGFEVIECATAEAAELVIASSGTELQALVTDNNLPGVMSGAELAQYASCQHPKMNIIIISGMKGEPYSGQRHVLAEALHCRAVARCSPRLKRVGLAPEIASIPHAFSHTASSLRTAAAEFPTFSIAF